MKFARACQLGDPCWEGVSGRGLALLAEAKGETEQAFAMLEDAAVRCGRRSDTYAWARAYILDAQCTLGRAYSHEGTVHWTEDLYDLVAADRDAGTPGAGDAPPYGHGTRGVDGSYSFKDDCRRAWRDRPKQTVTVPGDTPLATVLAVATDGFRISHPGDYTDAGKSLAFYRGDPSEAVIPTLPTTQTVTLVLWIEAPRHR